MFNWPADKKLVVPGVTQPVVSATLLSRRKEISQLQKTGEGVVITLPEKAPDNIASVIKLVVKGTVTDKRFTGAGASGL